MNLAWNLKRKRLTLYHYSYLFNAFFALIERQAVRNRVYSLYLFLKSEKQKIDINSLKSLQIELRSEMTIKKDKAILQCRVPLSEEKREKKSCLLWVDWSPTLPSASALPLYYEEKVKKTIFPQKTYKDNNTSHGKFHRFLFPFSDLNFAAYVLYIYLCHVNYATHTVSLWSQ